MRVEMFGTIGGRPRPSAARHRRSAGGCTRPRRLRSRLPVVFVMANIHAGEVEGKEAVLHLARRLTLGDLQPLLRSAVWLFAPIYNADGNERISLENRSEQYGPVGGVGTRENASGLDLNRDFMKLESSEARALVGLFTRWDPDVDRRPAHDQRLVSRLSPDLRAATQSEHRPAHHRVHARAAAAGGSTRDG